jgi:hypothetical protein
MAGLVIGATMNPVEGNQPTDSMEQPTSFVE